MMSNQVYLPRKTEQHLQLWIYLLPVVGVIPAIWTLYRANRNPTVSLKEDMTNATLLRQQQKMSRLAINLILIWLSSYALFSWGAGSASEIISFRLLYANAIITTGYFVICTFLMSRLGKQSLFSRDKMN
ncbi:MAG: hypothetical protein ACFCU7_16925 [Pleurocapsa sp.]